MTSDKLTKKDKQAVQLNECEDVCRDAIREVFEQYDALMSKTKDSKGKEKVRLTQSLDRIILDLINTEFGAKTGAKTT